MVEPPLGRWRRGLRGPARRTQRTDLHLPSLAEGIRIYAIGDIHGRADLLARMRALIDRDLEKTQPAAASLVLLGDYVDRGPDSKQVLDSLAGEPFPIPTEMLLGNHEAMLLAFLENAEAGRSWIRYGGVDSLRSYDVTVDGLQNVGAIETLAERLRMALPPSHLSLLKRLKPAYRLGGYFFCHAGVRPGIPLSEQNKGDLLWIRDEFIRSEEPFEAIVVHGHTPSTEPLVRPNAIGIDTGAYLTGRLTCLVLHSSGASFLTT